MGIGEAGELLRRATVHIRSSHGRRQSAGSGVIWDVSGTVMTNAHVLGNGRLDVETWDGRRFPAEVKSRDDQRDLATLQVPARGLQAAEFRETPVKPGEFVIAVGNPLGFTGALTTGSVRTLGPPEALIRAERGKRVCTEPGANHGSRHPYGWRREAPGDRSRTFQDA